MHTLALIAFVALQTAPVDPASASSAPGAPGADPVAALGLGALTSAPVQKGTTLYAPLASGGVAIVDVSEPNAPKLVSRMLEDRIVARVVIVDDTLVALVVQQEALSFSLANPQAPTVALPLVGGPGVVSGIGVTPPGIDEGVGPAPPGKEKPRRPSDEPIEGPWNVRAKVLEVKGGRVIFDAGSDAGFGPGARVRIISQRLVEKPSLTGEGTTQVPSGEVTAVVAIEEAEGARAMAKLGRGDVAFAGDIVELTPPDAELSERLFLPRRAPFSLRAGFHARPFLGLGSTSIGFLVDGYATYYFDSLPIAVTGQVAPVGFALLSREAHYPTTLTGLVSYTTDYFEIGVGAGALLGNPGPCFQEFDEFTGVPTGQNICEQNTGPTINQSLRLGSVDGLHVAWESSIFIRQPEGFVFGMGRAEVGVPVSSTLGLFAAGGGGENGWGFGEVGVRSFFGGTGAPGTLMLSASLGGAGVFDGPSHENVIGPSVAFGAEWRL